MPVESCVTPLFPFSQQSCPNRIRRPLEPMHFLLSGDDGGTNFRSIHGIQIKQEPEDVNESSGGEDKDFGDKWEQLSDEKSSKAFTNHLEDSQHQHPHLHDYNQHSPHHNTFQSTNSIQYHHQNSQSHQVPDEISLDSQDNPEGSNTVSASIGSSPFAEPTKEATSFLFVGPLGKKRKYSRQRATSDDNEPESHLPTAAGSPGTPEEMDHSQSPSSGESSQSEVGRARANSKGSLSQDISSPFGLSEPVSTIVSTPPSQRLTTSPESTGESASENSNMGGTFVSGNGTEGTTTIVSKPVPIIGAPTSVIRRVNRKKQEHPLPLNLSVSSPPSNSNNSYSSSPSSSTHPLIGTPPTAGKSAVSLRDADCSPNPSVIRDELYFEARTGSTDRQVFVWRYRDDIPATNQLSNALAGPMSPSSTISATSFCVPDGTGSKKGGSGASSSGSSYVSQIAPGSQCPSGQDAKNSLGGGNGSNASGKPPKKKLKCGDCGKEFSQLRNYRYHRSRHEGSDQFSCTCPVCGKQFNDRGYLSSHMKIHRNAKEYRCEYCTKGFNQRVAYNMHRRIHTGHRPHQCEVCGKSFSRRMLLKQHMRIHTGERPYSCAVCNKAFADRSNMLLHQRLHSGERPYVCEICKKSFSKNHHLKTHMNHHAGIKPYECPKCHARFSQSSNMKTHLKKCSGVPNPTTSQRQQMLRRNPVDIGRPTAQLTNLPGVVAAAAAAAAAASGRGEVLPPLSAASRLIYEQQSLSLLSQSMGNGPLAGVVGGSNSGPPQLSPGHSRGQVPIESLLLHLNVSRSRHPSQGSTNSGAPLSPTSGMSFPELQLMLRNAAAAAASSPSGSRQLSGSANYVQRSPSSPGSSSNAPSVNVMAGGMTVIPGMSSFGGMGINQPTNAGRRTSPVHGSMGTNEPMSPSPLSPIMSINSSLGGLVGYGVANAGGRASHSGGGHGQIPIDSTAMPPPSTNASMRNIPTPSSLIPQELLSPSAQNMLRIDTRGMEGYQTVHSPTEKSSRQGRVVPNPMLSPRRKPPSPSSISAGSSYIPLSTLETAAIASGLRSPSQVVRFLSSALREADSPLPQNNQQYTRLPSLSHHNVLEAMVAAAAAEQSGARNRQVPSPNSHHTHQQLNQLPPSPQTFQFTGEVPSLPSLHLNHPSGGSPSGTHHSQHVATAPSPFSVITSSHLLQHEQQQSLNMQQQGNVRFSSSAAARPLAGSSMDDHHHHHAADQQLQQVELHHHQQQQSSTQRQHGYHQSLLHNHVSQTSISQSSSSGYSSGGSGNGNSNPGYSAFSHTIIRSRSHSPSSVDHLRERNQDYQN